MLTVTKDANELDRQGISGVHYRLLSATSSNKTTGIIKQVHMHDGVAEISIVLRGTLTHKAEGINTVMNAGSMFFLPNQSIHQLIAPSDDLLLLNICAIPEIFDDAARVLNIYALPSKITYTVVEPFVIQFLLCNHKRLTETTDVNSWSTPIRSALLILLPFCCCNAFPNDDWFDNLLYQMKKQENFQAGIRRMQELAFCSPEHLCRTFKRRLHMTPTEYIDSLRVQYACSMLTHENKSILDICTECGYNTLSYFYKCFIKRTGLTPRQYQKEHNLTPIGSQVLPPFGAPDI